MVQRASSTTGRRSDRRRTTLQIDSIAQSWAVLSGAAEPQRARRADGVGGAAPRPARRPPGAPLRSAFDHRRSTPATSRDTSRASGERRSVPHSAVWSIVAFACSVTATRQRALRPADPLHHASRRANLHPTRRAVRRRWRDVYRSRRTWDGRLDLVKPGCGLALPRGPRVDPRLFARKAPRSAIDPCIPGAGSASRSLPPLRQRLSYPGLETQVNQSGRLADRTRWGAAPGRRADPPVRRRPRAPDRRAARLGRRGLLDEVCVLVG